MIILVSHETVGGERMDVLIQLVSSVGFPIAMCIYTTYTMGKMSEQHREEVSKLSETINNNTQAINDLALKLAKGD